MELSKEQLQKQMLKNNGEVVEWSTQGTRKLIKEVSSHPELYNPSHKFYSYYSQREKAWKNIANNLNISVVRCKYQWCKLRRCFANAIRRQTIREKRGCSLIKRWKYQKDMDFIYDVYLTKVKNLSTDPDYLTKRTRTTLTEKEEPNISIKKVVKRNPFSFKLAPRSLNFDYSSLGDIKSRHFTDSMSSINIDKKYVKMFTNNFPNHQDISNVIIVHPCDSKTELDEPSQMSQYIETESTICNVAYKTIVEEEESANEEDDKSCQKNKNSVEGSELDVNIDQELDSFFLNMSNIIKKFPLLEQMRVRSEVYKVVSTAETNWIKSLHLLNERR